MTGVAVVTDSTSDLGALASDRGISTVPLTITFGSEQYRDGIDLTSEEFYKKLERSSAPPITAQPAPALFAETYRRLLQEGADGILSLHLSSALSGTYNSAQLAAKEVDRSRISVVDSRSVSLGLGLLVLSAAENARAGMDLARLTQQAINDSAKVQVFATIPTLTYLARGGRIGQLQSILGNVLKIVPIITLKDGEVAEYSKVRTFSRAVDQIIEIVAAKVQHNDAARCAVLHSVAPALAEKVAERIRAAVHPKLLVINCVGPTVGTHTGPGAVGAVFIE